MLVLALLLPCHEEKKLNNQNVIGNFGSRVWAFSMADHRNIMNYLPQKRKFMGTHNWEGPDGHHLPSGLDSVTSACDQASPSLLVPVSGTHSLVCLGLTCNTSHPQAQVEWPSLSFSVVYWTDNRPTQPCRTKWDRQGIHPRCETKGISSKSMEIYSETVLLSFLWEDPISLHGWECTRK